MRDNTSKKMVQIPIIILNVTTKQHTTYNNANASEFKIELHDISFRECAPKGASYNGLLLKAFWT